MEDKRRLIIILAVLAFIVGLVIYGMFTQSRRSAANTAALNAQNAANMQPAPQTDADRAAASNAVSVITNPQDDRVRIGGTLPFPLPANAAVETEGGKLVSANITLQPSDTGPLEALAPQDGKVWVMIEMEPSNKRSILGKSITRAMEVVQPILQDSQGQMYEPCGLIYRDMGTKIVNVDPMGIVRGLSQAPRLEESRSDQALWLVFLLPPGTEVQSFSLGKKKMVEWAPGVPVK